MKYGNIVNNVENKFYDVKLEDINSLEGKLNILVPEELKNFWKEVGYVFISGSENNVNRIMDPISVMDFRLRQGDFEFYPDIDIYDEFEDNKLIFFEANESALISIELTNQDTNKIFYYDVEIANSLAEFLVKLQEDDSYYLELLD